MKIRTSSAVVKVNNKAVDQKILDYNRDYELSLQTAGVNPHLTPL